ncbi:MAG: bifunctional phosphoribosylaminoimidazolecarboxamide formyltransferase/IMP cyclohydrolase [Synechococcus sp. SB0678_bin_12]|uniref:Bifunctional purine biosynthesis protein PurH n=1 Tax=Synechococcus sp. SB0676_bin_10 TaxID=2604869 RepID=A0A6B1F655_9SYNE|nr:bifunctional phosphoribosylaminoimidazolecarboxamide formyltransferase/IMP cyclohydrolase [Synechococcus sp. SB0678_bin_12]MYG38239.1 bifunctional phosphoribosylaminoimidazolecarboxamide formyltransferase/IMP cyclohydrolase [Synechococcus sp. SB0676_bin_10]MYK07202.1 bifunctional phosphoribosylaminoimidazolecarboxamide formyltransferase/IMP cyclohydrolase [Synechococcus sp. SB0670_bin_20]
MAPTALLSVFDKTGLAHLATTLQQRHGFQLVCSGGTAQLLREEAGLTVTAVADHTGAPELLNGRVKTLHPHIHGGILADRHKPEHLEDLQRQGIPPIDLVVVNLYPFESTVADATVTWEQAIEVIDIGGPAMLRAAAKNHAHVSVLTAASQYASFLETLAAGGMDLQQRRQLALAAFRHSARYEAAVSQWFGAQLEEESEQLQLTLPQRQRLRYGENPHQPALWYGESQVGWGAARQLQGKQLSFNNLLDLDAALASVQEFPSEQAAAVVVKHTNPCGVATGADLATALQRALAADEMSAFGSVVAVNQLLDAATAAQLAAIFVECVVAPGVTVEALECLARKPNLRLLTLDQAAVAGASGQQLRTILGGVLVQQRDQQPVDRSTWQVVSTAQPDATLLAELDFAWRVVRHVRSNAIVVSRGQRTLGIGAGQMNRVGAAELALAAAGERAQGAILASDGFFPFPDTVHLAAGSGIRALIQPGGSKRDEESIAACNARGLVMICTGRRHFLH